MPLSGVGENSGECNFWRFILTVPRVPTCLLQVVGVTTPPWLADLCVTQNHCSLLNVTCPEGHSPTIQYQCGPLCILIYLILSLGLFMLLRVYWDENFC